jgi:hypothetical protein
VNHRSHRRPPWRPIVARAAALLVGLAASLAHAGWEEAVDAYNKGDYATAAREFRPFAEQEQAQAQFILGWIYQNGEGVARDFAESAKWYAKAAAKGNADAQSALGSYYMSGAGVKRDDAEAAKWFRKAAEQGKGQAQYLLGYLLARGEGLPKNEAEGAQWTRKAAEQNLPDAQYALALALSNGTGVNRDETEANTWFRKAAEQGNLDAAFLLASNYERGIGVLASYPDAVKWYRVAADGNNADAQYHLGTMYRDGYGVDRDDAAAMGWFRKAAAADQPSVIGAVDEYLKRGKFDLAFELGDTLLAKRGDRVQLQMALAFAAAREARGEPAKFAPLAKKYGEPAIAAIEGGRKPPKMTDADWSDYRTKWLPQLHTQLGLIAQSTGATDEARTRFERVTALDPQDAYGWYLLGQTWFGEYQKLDASAKTLDGAAKSEAVAKAFGKLDQVIDAYARAVAFSDRRDGMQSLAEPLMRDLAGLYEFRHGSKNGLDALLGKYRGG